MRAGATASRSSCVTTYYAIDDLSERWGVTRRITNEYVRRHGFPAPLAFSGRTRRWPIDEVDAWEVAARQKRRTGRLPRPAPRKTELAPVIVRRAA